MPNGNGISGVRGDAIYNTGGTQISEVKKFSWNPSQETKDYASNKTGGAKKRVSSVKDGSGSLDGVWDPWDPITDHMEPGTEVTLKLQHYTGQFWVVPAIIDDMSFEVDIETGDVQTWTANFSLNGPWTKPTALPSTTTTTTTAGFLGEFSQAQALSMPQGQPQAPNFQHAPAYQPETPQATPQGWPVWRGQQPAAQQPAHAAPTPAMNPEAIDAIARRVAELMAAGKPA